MSYDGVATAAAVSELQQNLTLGKIEKIYQPHSEQLIFNIHTKAGRKKLLLSVSGNHAGAYLTETVPENPASPPVFCMVMRKHLNAGRITQIQQHENDRIIEILLETVNEMGFSVNKKLIIEIMGKHSNIIFCSEDGTIIDSIKHVSAQMSSVREVLPGRKYFIPDTMHKKDPLTTEWKEFSLSVNDKPMSVAKALYTSFTGISPVTAEEICYLAGIDSTLPAKEYSQDVLFHLYTQFTIYLSAIKEGRFEPAIYYDKQEPKEFSALELTYLSAYEKRLFPSVCEILRTYYSERSLITRIRQKSVDLRHIVQTALERNRKKYDLQMRQLKDTENRDKYKVYGELINAYGYNVPEGAKQMEALNYYTNETVTIPLDPTSTPQENAQRFFAKYNKQKRTFEALTQLIRETKDEISYLESIQTSLDIAMTEDDLAAIKEELSETGYVRRKTVRKKIKLKNEPLHYISSDGFHMYVGKNNLQNDALTFDFAAGCDWWFHAKQAPGSHVIVKTNGEELPDRTFEEAGKLAAYYSSMRGSEKVEIDYIEKKHIKKPKGAKPGFVVYYTNYSLVIDSDIRGIQKISGS